MTHPEPEHWASLLFMLSWTPACFSLEHRDRSACVLGLFVVSAFFSSPRFYLFYSCVVLVNKKASVQLHGNNCSLMNLKGNANYFKDSQMFCVRWQWMGLRGLLTCIVFLSLVNVEHKSENINLFFLLNCTWKQQGHREPLKQVKFPLKSHIINALYGCCCTFTEENVNFRASLSQKRTKGEMFISKKVNYFTVMHICLSTRASFWYSPSLRCLSRWNRLFAKCFAVCLCLSCSSETPTTEDSVTETSPGRSSAKAHPSSLAANVENSNTNNKLSLYSTQSARMVYSAWSENTETHFGF